MKRYKGIMPASHQFNLDEARELWADGKDTNDIAKHFMCAEAFVYHMLANGALKKKTVIAPMGSTRGNHATLVNHG